MGVKNYYNESYFLNYQKSIGEFGGLANKFKFEKEIGTEDTLLDFGCGGGFLLNNLNAGRKIGVEVNKVARDFAIDTGLECYESLDYVDDDSIDTIISNHVLEHVEVPLEIVREFRRILKPGGKVVIVVPWDLRATKWKSNDVDNHLYSYSPLNVGNLFQSVGFQINLCEELVHKWPRGYRRIMEWFGPRIFNFFCRINGRMNSDRTQVKLIAINKK